MHQPPANKRNAKRNRIPPVTFVATGLFLIAASLLWPRVTILHGAMSDSGVDFIQGALAGIGLACEATGIVGLLSRRRKRGSHPGNQD